jgi:hypothetical protein
MTADLDEINPDPPGKPGQRSGKQSGSALQDMLAEKCRQGKAVG